MNLAIFAYFFETTQRRITSQAICGQLPNRAGQACHQQPPKEREAGKVGGPSCGSWLSVAKQLEVELHTATRPNSEGLASNVRTCALVLRTRQPAPTPSEKSRFEDTLARPLFSLEVVHVRFLYSKMASGSCRSCCVIIPMQNCTSRPSAACECDETFHEHQACLPDYANIGKHCKSDSDAKIFLYLLCAGWASPAASKDCHSSLVVTLRPEDPASVSPL